MPLTRSGAGPSDAVLVMESRAGAGWAQEALFRRHAPMVNRLAFRLLGSDADLNDLVQESFAQALSSLHRLRNDEVFPAWISTIVVRTAHKILRHRRLLTRLGLRRSEPVDWEAITAKGTPADVAAEIKVLYRLVDQMPEKLRIPLILRHVEEATLDEIAGLTGVSLATVKRRLNEAQALLDEALVQEGGKRS
jgi:RNA polymerase sigma-70 factor (ECF subfamily)